MKILCCDNSFNDSVQLLLRLIHDYSGNTTMDLLHWFGDYSGLNHGYHRRSPKILRRFFRIDPWLLRLFSGSLFKFLRNLRDCSGDSQDVIRGYSGVALWILQGFHRVVPWLLRIYLGNYQKSFYAFLRDFPKVF